MMHPKNIVWILHCLCTGALTLSQMVPTVREHKSDLVRTALFLKRHGNSFFQTNPLELMVSLSGDNEDDSILVELPGPSEANTTRKNEIKWVDESKYVELMGLSLWMASIIAFILINNFVGAWPSFMDDVPERVWFLLHMLGGMLFGGGVLLTTAIEYLVATTGNSSVLQFWFDKVPLLDVAIVLPGLTVAMISGTGLSIEHYGGLGQAPAHIQYVFWTLIVFAAWWGVTDLTTQGSALKAVQEHALSSEDQHVKAPDVVLKRTVSNVVSCLLVFVVYSIMVFKPGSLHFW